MDGVEVIYEEAQLKSGDPLFVGLRPERQV
jgi:hypothetical protein